MVALDQEFESLEAQVTTLQAEKLHLEAQVNPLKREIERLKHQIENVTAQDHESLDPVAAQILLALANGESDRERIFSALNLPKIKGDHLYDILSERKLIEYKYGTAFVTPIGRAYLVQNTLPETERPDNPKGYRCDHCGSPKLKRTGSKPHPHFSEMGVKNALFTCLECRKESTFMEDPNE